MGKKITIVHYSGDISNSWSWGSYRHKISRLIDREGTCKFGFSWRYAKVNYTYQVILTETEKGWTGKYKRSYYSDNDHKMITEEFPIEKVTCQRGELENRDSQDRALHFKGRWVEDDQEYDMVIDLFETATHVVDEDEL